MRIVIFLFVFGLLASLAVVALRLLFPLPDATGRAESRAIPASAETRLGGFMAAGLARHPGKTGVAPGA